MITDKQRREMARTLRGLDESIDGENPLRHHSQLHDAMALRGIRAVVGRGDIFHLLADFIDRETCEDVYVPRGDGFTPYVTFKCSACGTTHVSLWYCRYCPSCGAEVLDEDGAN